MALSVDQDRLAERLDALADIGRDQGGGITRLVYSEEERAAAEVVAEWMRAAALEVRHDVVGNLFGRWPARPGPALWTGSHLDSVPNGGRFDGPAGVLASLAAIEALQGAGIRPAVPIELCVFVGEEGSRFSGGLLGSRAVAEGLSAADLAGTDAQGISLREAMLACGLDPGRVPEARVDPRAVRAYLELHTEQGPVLEEANLSVGIVAGIAGPMFLEGEVVGRSDHAGTTPMGSRADSLLGAAELALELERIASARRATVGTVGRVLCRPGAHNVIAGTTQFTVDLRDTDLESRDEAESELRATFDRILSARGLTGSLRDTLRVPPQPTPEHLLVLLEQATHAAGVPAMRLWSGAAHDAMVMGRITDGGMIFVRSIGGRSHTPEEETRMEDLAAGAGVLAEAVKLLCA
jgi:allantoate deiminase